ncbi:MAG TPA: tetratricopeptide repeat protein [Thermoanaerobaculia bacterium]|nr:tetratricopeptide repeat protein [Thermoanaerobaculia bacterium]
MAGSFLRLVIEQQGIDAKISLHQPQSSKPLEIDGVNEDLGQEELVAVLPPTGSFFVEVVASEDEPHPPARLRLVRFEQRPPTPTDLDLLRQDQALRLGRELRDGGNPDDPLPPLREAATLARKLGLPCREADSSQELEEIHADRGQFQLALAFAQQARELYRGCPEPLLQAVAARSVGWARLKLGELPQAIVELEAALELCHQAARPSCSALAESYLGSANQQLGRLQTAIEHFDRDPRYAIRQMLAALKMLACFAYFDAPAARAPFEQPPAPAGSET